MLIIFVHFSFSSLLPQFRCLCCSFFEVLLSRKLIRIEYAGGILSDFQVGGNRPLRAISRQLRLEINGKSEKNLSARPFPSDLEIRNHSR